MIFIDQYNTSFWNKSVFSGCIFIYFAYIDVDLKMPQDPSPMLNYVIFFIIGTSFIFFVIVSIDQWRSRPLYHDPRGELSRNGANGLYSEGLKRKALKLVPMLAGTTFLGWIISGLLLQILFITAIGVALSVTFKGYRHTPWHVKPNKVIQCPQNEK